MVFPDVQYMQGLYHMPDDTFILFGKATMLRRLTSRLNDDKLMGPTRAFREAIKHRRGEAYPACLSTSQICSARIFWDAFSLERRCYFSIFSLRYRTKCTLRFNL